MRRPKNLLIVQHDTTDQTLFPDLILRRERKGPESEMLRDFLREFEGEPSNNTGHVAFVEPRLEGSYPDAVVVGRRKWKGSSGDSLISGQFSKGELRIVQLLYNLGPSTVTGLSRYAGGGIERSLDVLASAGLVYRRKNHWRLAALDRAFPVSSIVAFEAKMVANTRVLEQAASHRWFAHAAYVLLPKKPTSDSFIQQAEQWGVGIWVSGEPKPYLTSAFAERGKPVSYGSWLVCSWASRIAA